MKAIIMAGGFGTRLRPLTINMPKPLTPVANLPIMEHVINRLAAHGITDITALLFFQADKIRDHFGNGSQLGVRINYVQPLEDYGTAGAVRRAIDDPSDTVLVISGDLITDFDLSAAIKWHREKKAETTILLTRRDDPLPYGIVITDADGRIVRFLEKPSWGEAFSDTINTGIYLMEPQAVELIPKLTSFDFSQNLFPLMLKRRMGLYGMIMDGYWKDVGNISEYHRVHLEFFKDLVSFQLPGKEETFEKGTLIRGDRVSLGENVEISGKVVLGNDVQVGSGTRLHNCTIGDRAKIGSGCRITGSVLWEDLTVGNNSVLSHAIVCSMSRLGNNVELLDKVVVANDCRLGDGATVKANCKIWPGKTVDAGATVSTSIVWGEKWNRELFTNSKITGQALTEITPEMAVRVGAAFGAFLGQGQSVVLSRDASDSSRLLKRGLIAGLLAAGVDVADLETVPVPVVRYTLTRGENAAGIYVRHNPQDFRQIDLIFFDGSGIDMPTSRLQKVERMYLGEDFERASLDNIGHLRIPQRVLDDYRADFLRNIDRELIKKAGFKVVVDHSNGSSSQIFPTLFTELGISATELNANLNPRKFPSSPEEYARTVAQLSAIVTSLHADIGLKLNPAAEKLTVIDETGQPVDSQTLLLCTLYLFLQTHQVKKIATPVGASMGVEELAAEHNVEVVRVGNDHLSMMRIKQNNDVDFVGGTRGGFIFPGQQLGSDAMVTTVKLMEMMARTNSRFADLRSRFEHLNRQTLSVPCPWSKKGAVMRHLITSSDQKKRQLIDGIRVFEEAGWVLVAPDRFTAAFNIMAESHSKQQTTHLVDRYREMVEAGQTS